MESVECLADSMHVRFNAAAKELSPFYYGGGGTISVKGNQDESCQGKIRTVGDQTFDVPLNDPKCGVEVVSLV